MARLPGEFVSTAVLCAALAACAPAPTAGPVDPLVAPLVGRTLISDGASIAVNSDGTLSGTVGRTNPEPLVGTWTARNGEWCRTISAPDRLAGSECQSVIIAGDTATFTSPTGRQTAMRIQ